eukprot:6766060-Ditylum_brightwellii.AAC.1
MKFPSCERSMLAATALLTYPLLTTAENTSTYSNTCYFARTDLASSYLSEIKYPTNILKSEQKIAIQSFSQEWKSLTKESNAPCKE